LKLPDNNPTFEEIKILCYKKPWVVYSEKPFNTPENLIHYLGNYTHRVAISNHRIIENIDGTVSFYYKNNKKGGIRNVMKLNEEEFIRRFLFHVLPKGFSKIRYFGFLSLRNLKINVDACIDILNKEVFLPILEGLSGYEIVKLISGYDPYKCPLCIKGKMIIQLNLDPVPS
jgi:Putative transposase.